MQERATTRASIQVAGCRRCFSALRGRGRAAWRLAATIALTARYGAALAVLRYARGQDHARGAATTQKWANLLLTRLGVDVQISGERPAEATVMVANHRSYVDIPLIAASCPTNFLAKHEVSRWPVIGACANAAGTVFVRRGDRDSQRRARLVLQRRAARHQSVTIFAEGTTATGPGMLPMRPGAFRIAADADVQLAPIAITYDRRDAAYVGDDRFGPHFLRLFRHRRLRAHISFGPVCEGRTATEKHAAATAWFAAELPRLEALAATAQRREQARHQARAWPQER